MTEEAKARILVADDDARQLKALCGLLEEHGHEAVGFRDGQAALQALASGRFDVVLADLMMPGVDGIALVKAAAAVAPTAACVVVTGFGEIETAVEAMQAGALDYVTKPCRLSVVLPAVERALAVHRRRIENAASLTTPARRVPHRDRGASSARPVPARRRSRGRKTG